VPRPRKCRMIRALPEITYFKPRGVPMRDLNEVYLPLEGLEALRLADLDGLDHENAAQRMGISRQTFGRILTQAHQIVAKALISGMALCIQGGDYQLDGAVTSDPGVPDLTDCSRTPPYPKEHIKGKIAISSEGPALENRLDPRFGRAAGFIIVDSETLTFEYIDNGDSQARAQGAGIQAARKVAATGAKAVLTGFVGAKAFEALQAAGLKVIQNLENMTVRQAIERYRQDALTWANAPNRGHHDR
jgi:predicted DNA-binding protein (UPF0251 family)/predicted Fe-Mo cluster-binding NifX family protein